MSLTGPGAAMATTCAVIPALGKAVYNPVTVTAGVATNTTIASPDGSFCFATMPNGTYTITPSLTGFTFSPPNLTLQVLNVDAIINNYFTNAPVHTTTFSIYTSVQGAAVNGVTMNLTGMSTQTLTVPTSGANIFSNLPNGYYVVTPSMPGYLFAPPSMTALVNNWGVNYSQQPFTSARIGTGSHTISGQVLGGTSKPVKVTLSGQASATTTTDANGNFYFTGQPAGIYTIRPSLAGYTFGPASLDITLVQYDSVSNTFVATSTTTPPPQPTLPSGPPNILLNPSFEYGHQCYNFWGNPAGGNWGPFVSTDSHSGRYSAELACRRMPGCDSSFMVTGGIPVVAGKNFKFSGWAKCPGTAAVNQAYYYLQSNGTNGPQITGVNAARITCDGRWHQNTFTITVPSSSTATAFNLGIFNNTICAACDPSVRGASLKTDDWSLTYSDRTAPTHVWQHPGRRNVYVTPSALYVDGKPYLLLGTYGVPVKDFAAVAAMGMNTIASPPDVNATPTPECYNLGSGSKLDTAYNLGLNILGDITTNSRVALEDNGRLQAIGTGGVATMAAYAHQFGQHLAHIGWFVDEPDLVSYPWFLIDPATFVQFGNALRSQSPLPFAVDFQGAHWRGYSHMVPFNGSSTIWISETYGTSFSAVNTAYDTFNTVQKRPVWIFQGSPNVGNDAPYYLTVVKSYYAIINGITGVLYFSWNGFHNTKGAVDQLMLNAVGQAVTELKSLQGPIMEGHPIAVTATGGPAIMAREYNGQTFILAVTPVWGQYTATFNVPGLRANTPVTVQFENRTISSSAGSFTDTFAGQVRHVYVIGTANSTRAGAYPRMRKVRKP